ncbi:ABC transporter substrate-binding protein [Brevibacillus nitrificans]|uniref:ABC transporter substrate-binding protein n=1 Tax=Brevibacillus nitrificans TaxID=651560 RepID=UPI00260B95C6|nr:ABC transporter substrate-binding protein [Brevibacillus nitrificans]
MKRINRSISIAAVASLLLLAGCGGGNTATSGTGSSATPTNSGGSTTSAAGKTMFLGLVNPPILFNPINSADVASQFVEKFMFDSFLEMEAPLKFVPKLADSFETTDNQTYTIKINKDAKWSDGKPVTAEDVAFTFNLIANPKVEISVGSYLSMFEGTKDTGKLEDGKTELPAVKVIDEKTIEFKTKAPVDPNMIKEQLGTKLMILPKHALEKIDPAALSQDPFMQKPTVTNGPFKFVQYKKDQYVEFEKNPDYYLGAPQLDKMFIKIMPAPNLVAQLQTGELQMNIGNGIGKIPPQDYETVKKFENVTTKSEAQYGFQTMMFNTEKITDPRVRQAITYALDRQQIVDKLLRGYGEIVDGPYTSVSPYLDKNLEKYSYNVEKAKQLLQEAGWDFNRELNFVVPLGNKVREQSADILTQNLKAIGLKVKVSTFDFPTIMQKAKAGDYELLLMGLTFTLDPEVSSLYSSIGSFNFMNYNNPKVDELLLKGKAEANPEKRKQIYNELQAIWNQDVPLISLYSDSDFFAYSKQVATGEPKIFGFHNHLEKWSMGGAQ